MNSFDHVYKQYQTSKHRLLVFDYDGTLVDFAPTPAQAIPPKKLIELLKKLSQDHRNKLMIISGRGHDSLNNWLGNLPIELISEYGGVLASGQTSPRVATNHKWQPIIRPYIIAAVKQTPGATLEQKQFGLVFHYRQASNQVAALKNASQLYEQLEPIANDLNLNISHENMALEVSVGGISKVQILAQELKREQYDFKLYAGDGQPDEACFRLLGTAAVAIKIGQAPTAASTVLKTPAELLSFLSRLGDIDH